MTYGGLQWNHWTQNDMNHWVFLSFATKPMVTFSLVILSTKQEQQQQSYYGQRNPEAKPVKCTSFFLKTCEIRVANKDLCFAAFLRFSLRYILTACTLSCASCGGCLGCNLHPLRLQRMGNNWHPFHLVRTMWLLLITIRTQLIHNKPLHQSNDRWHVQMSKSQRRAKACRYLFLKPWKIFSFSYYELKPLWRWNSDSQGRYFWKK